MQDAITESPTDDTALNSEQVNSNETGGIVSDAVNLLRGLFGA
jgi:hypothetical protein